MLKKIQILSVTITMVILCSYLVSCTAVPPKLVTTTSIENTEYRLGTGDTIRLIVFGHEELSGEFSVGSNGKISFPLILDTQVSGLTTKEVEKLVTEKLSPAYLSNPKVSIEVIKYRDIYIIGEVRNPGKYPFVPNMTIQKAVAVAGGYTYRAQENRAKLTHQSQNTITTKIVDITSTVSPGDTITITRKWF